MNTLKINMIRLLLLVLATFLFIDTVDAAIRVEPLTYTADQENKLVRFQEDSNPNDNSIIRIPLSRNIRFFNTSSPDDFRFSSGGIRYHDPSGGKLRSDGDIEITINFNGVSETHIIANIDVATGALTYDSGYSVNDELITTIPGTNNICVLGSCP